MNWGNTDDAANSVFTAPEQVSLTNNTANQTALFRNTTVGAFLARPTVAVGQFAVTAAQASVTNGAIISVTVKNPGSGYSSNATVTIDGNATANAQANSSGKITSINLTSNGSNYTGKPNVVVSAPTPQSFNANTAVVANAITLSPNPFVNNDVVTYGVAAGNTALTNLVNGNSYTVFNANSTTVQLALSSNGPAITITSGVTETGHSLTGKTATAVSLVSGNKGIAHSGYNLRTVGTGGRAGRVQWETLVATGSLTSASPDGVVLKNS